jgi:sugar/nucleoside kinase (ribokinase family)
MLRLFRPLDICAVGAGTRDVFITSTHFEREPDAKAPDGFDACFPMGAKIPLDEVIFETGGGATNAAVTFRRFGLKTACFCAVGDDPNGQDVIDALKKEKIDTRGVQVMEGKKTSYSVILLAGTGQRSILVYRGAANTLDFDRSSWDKLSCRWYYLTSLGGDLAKNKALFRRAKAARSSVAWNPGNGELALGLKALSPMLKQTDILIMNREEAAVLADCEPKDLDSIFKTLGPLPQTALVVTDGGHGAYVCDRQTGELLYSPALPGRRINTTGAGDAFGSAFVAAYLKSGDSRMALRAGLLNSLGVITHMGAKAGILERFPGAKNLARIRIQTLPSSPDVKRKPRI